MTAPPKIERCPFPSCGGKCETTEYQDDSWRVDCRQILSCDYSGPRCRTEAEAVAAHNKVALAVRLFPRACGLLRELHAVVSGECPSLFEELSGGDAELAIDIEDILAEAQGVADAE